MLREPCGYCDLCVENIDDDIIEAYIEHGYSCIAVNTTVNCSHMKLSKNKKKRKIAECYDEEVVEDNVYIPLPKSVNNDNNFKLTILNRLTIKIIYVDQLKKVMNSQHFSKYNILAVEPLDDRIIQELVNWPSIDILICKANTMISAKDYIIALEKQIFFEISYAGMLMNSVTRQDTITLAHLYHIKGKSKNIIITSGTSNKFDIRHPNDIMNLGTLLGLSIKQSKESISNKCHSIMLKSIGRKLGKTAIVLIPMKTA